jgi:hypothetical protein
MKCFPSVRPCLLNHEALDVTFFKAWYLEISAPDNLSISSNLWLKLDNDKKRPFSTTKLKVKVRLYRPITGPEFSRSLRFSHFETTDTWRLSALSTGLLYPTGNIPENLLLRMICVSSPFFNFYIIWPNFTKLRMNVIALESTLTNPKITNESKEDARNCEEAATLNTGWTVQGSNPGKGKRFYFSPKRPDRLCDPPSLLHDG